MVLQELPEVGEASEVTYEVQATRLIDARGLHPSIAAWTWNPARGKVDTNLIASELQRSSFPANILSPEQVRALAE
jgi:hypothetical protein